VYPSNVPSSQFKLQRLVTREGVVNAASLRDIRYHALPNTSRIVTHAPAAFALARLPQSPIQSDPAFCEPEIHELNRSGVRTNDSPTNPLAVQAPHLRAASQMEVHSHGD
jgi:hypothetical protein